MIRSILLAGAALALAATPALAQPLSREDLEAALKQRDDQIAALEKRIAALEAGRAAVSTAQPVGDSVAAGAPVANVAHAEAPAGAGVSGAGAKDDEVALQALSRGLV